MRNPVSTISGAILLAISLVSVYLGLDEQEMLNLETVIPQIVGSVYSIFLMFGAKDGSTNLKQNL